MYEVCIRFFVKPASSAQIAKKMRTQLVELACRTWSSSIYHISTAQRNQPCTKERSTYVPTRVRQRKQADRVGESQHVVERLSAARCVVLKTNKEIETCPAKKDTRRQAAGDARRICLYLRPISLPRMMHDTTLSFLFRTYSYDPCMLRPGCFPGAWNYWHLQVVGLPLNSWNLSVRFVRIFFCSILSLWASVARGAKRLTTRTSSAGNTVPFYIDIGVRSEVIFLANLVLYHIPLSWLMPCFFCCRKSNFMLGVKR